MTSQNAKVTDRRVARTQKLLRDALHSLIRERDYDSIVVKEILDRADVGRSAFYTHFHDKDELLASSLYDLLGSVPSMRTHGGDDRGAGILWFSLPIFEHHEQRRRAGELRLGARGRAVLHGRLQHILTELISREILGSSHRKRKAAGRIPPDLLVQHIASTFILVLNWWVESESPLPAIEVNRIFHAMITPALGGL